jgi:hypothetical protein
MDGMVIYSHPMAWLFTAIRWHGYLQPSDGIVIYSHPIKFFLLFNRQVFATINALSQS